MFTELKDEFHIHVPSLNKFSFLGSVKTIHSFILSYIIICILCLFLHEYYGTNYFL